MSKWQPIKTAPRIKGNLILGWDGSEMMTLEYSPPYKYPKHIDHDEAWIQVSDSGRATQYFPTHWMSLPQPPNR